MTVRYIARPSAHQLGAFLSWRISASRWYQSVVLIPMMALASCGAMPDSRLNPRDLEAGAQTQILFKEARIPDYFFEVFTSMGPRRITLPQFYWVNDHTAVGTLWRLDEWVAGPQELPQNWAFDLRSGLRWRLPIDGSIVCARPEHVVVVRSPAEHASERFTRIFPKDMSHVLVGTLNGDFVPFVQSKLANQVDAKHPLNDITCLPEPFSGDFPMRESLSYSVIRLGKDGYLGRNHRGAALLPPGTALPQPVWTVFDAERQPLSHWNGACGRAKHPSSANLPYGTVGFRSATWPDLQNDLLPVAHLGAYLVNTLGAHPADGSECPKLLVYPDGRIDGYLSTPTALTHIGASLVGITPRGAVWNAVQGGIGDSKPKRPGLYLQIFDPNSQLPSEVVIPILLGGVEPLSQLSPNGCRLIVALTPDGLHARYQGTRTPWKARQSAAFLHLNFCK